MDHANLLFTHVDSTYLRIPYSPTSFQHPTIQQIQNMTVLKIDITCEFSVVCHTERYKQVHCYTADDLRLGNGTQYSTK